MNIILGLDLSIRAAAVVAVPSDWDGRWSRVQSMVAGESLPKGATDNEHALRNQSIANAIIRFARRVGATHAYIEGYAFSRRSSSVHQLAELGGVVRLELVRDGLEVATVNMGQARKLLLGKVPRESAKLAVYDAFIAAGRRFESLDESDAMAIANYGCAQHGAFFFGQEQAA